MSEEGKALSPFDAFRSAMANEKMQQRFLDTIPNKSGVKGWTEVAVGYVAENPALLTGDSGTFWSALFKCCQSGLLLDGKEACLIPRGQKICFQSMVYGKLKLIRNSGVVAVVNAATVFEGEPFEIWTDDKGQHFKHTPNVFGDRVEKNAIGSYAYAILKTGEVIVEPMNKTEIQACRDKGQKNSDQWVAFFTRGWEKSAINRLYTRLPSSGDIVGFYDDEEEAMIAPPVEAADTTVPSRAAALAEPPAPPAEPVVTEGAPF